MAKGKLVKDMSPVELLRCIRSRDVRVRQPALRESIHRMIKYKEYKKILAAIDEEALEDKWNSKFYMVHRRIIHAIHKEVK